MPVKPFRDIKLFNKEKNRTLEDCSAEGEVEFEHGDEIKHSLEDQNGRKLIGIN